MKTLCRVLFLGALIATTGPRAARADECTDELVQDGYACHEVLVEYDPLTFDAQGVAGRHGLTLIGSLPQIERAWFLAPDTRPVTDLIQELLDTEPSVLEAERNGKMTSPECRQWTIAALPLGPGAGDLYRNQPALPLLRVPAGVATLGAGITIAVLDTGIAEDSLEIPSARRRTGIDVLSPGGAAADPANGIDDDLDGRVDAGQGHGTAVASLIHAVAPGAVLLPVRVLDDECHGTAFSFAAGVVAAVDAGARVLNLSFGSLDSSSAIAKAIDYAADRGAVVFAPVGNGGSDDVQFPASNSDVFAVAAVDDSLLAAAFTDHSSKVSLVAPGVDVIAPHGIGYSRLSGTSFATAFVSGVAAIAWEQRPGLDGREIGRLLEDRARSVDGQNPELDGELGEGIPDVSRLWTPFRLPRARPTTGAGMPLPTTGGVRVVTPAGGPTAGGPATP